MNGQTDRQTCVVGILWKPAISVLFNSYPAAIWPLNPQGSRVERDVRMGRILIFWAFGEMCVGVGEGLLTSWTFISIPGWYFRNWNKESHEGKSHMCLQHKQFVRDRRIPHTKVLWWHKTTDTLVRKPEGSDSDVALATLFTEDNLGEASNSRLPKNSGVVSCFNRHQTLSGVQRPGPGSRTPSCFHWLTLTRTRLNKSHIPY